MRSIRRSAFTLVEMLVVIGILLAVTTMVIVAFRPSDSEKMRTASRIAQSAVLGAKDRAVHAKERRGFRLLLDPNDANVGIGFLYLQPLPKQRVGQPAGATVTVARPDTAGGDYAGPDPAANDTPIYLLIDGPDGQSIRNLDLQGMLSPLNVRIRIPADDGQYYKPVVLSATPPHYTQVIGTRTLITLSTSVVEVTQPMPAVESLPATLASAEFDLGNEILPNGQPIPLPSGVVVDLNQSSGAARGDIMYSPRGALNGAIAGQGLIHFLLRDIRDVTEGIDPANVAAGVQHRENMILTLNPQTGHCQSYPVDQSDGNGDSIADDLFRFAKIGSRAGN